MPDFAADFELHRYGIAYNAGMLMIPKRNEARGKFIRYRFFVMPDSDIAESNSADSAIGSFLMGISYVPLPLMGSRKILGN
jgi:hypothetical protein